ncbi:MAG: FAD-dependent monooxygenase [Ancalomicrobiaceae bacterium]|nr:FAD-dependent monooxygenase [Ancalomicrobiaceae bacterium]
MRAERHIIIVGAGIAGLTAALTLDRIGVGVTLLEQASALSEVGAGLQLSPNASRILIEQDIGQSFRTAAFYPDSIRVLSTRSGGEVANLPLGAAFAARYGAPYLVIHRADLQASLVAAVTARGSIDLRLGITVTSVEQTDSGVTVRLASGETFSGDALIGADGVRSYVRTEVLGGAAPRYSGRLAYRATIPIEHTPEPLRSVTCVWMAPRAHLVHYPVKSGREFNLVAVAESEWQSEGWSTPVARADVLKALAPDTDEVWPEIPRGLLATPTNWTKWALCAVDPRFTWTKGRITLVGDAAHAMLPFAAQGAAMAIEDAEVLAASLKRERDVATALKAYEAARKPRVTAVVDLAAANGRIYHLGSVAAFARDAALRYLPPLFALNRQDWVYAWRSS